MSSGEIEVPDVDVCAFCSDIYCDGIACIAALDPDDTDDLPQIERLHDLIRAGRAFLGAERVLDDAEGRGRKKER